MHKLSWFLAIIAISASAYAIDFGFDFRSTATYVTDPSYAAAVVISGGYGKRYPTVYTNGAGQTVTAGWNCSVINGRNRTTSNDPRLAGVQFDASTGQTVRTFTVTLPAAGPYNISLAMGDRANPQKQCVALEDNTTAFATYKSVATPSNGFMDATGVVRAEAKWVSSNATLAHTFSSTTFNVVIGCGTSGQSSTLAHVRITSAAGAVGNPPTLTSLSPANGPTTGGTAVTLAGTSFASGTAVTFGSAAATFVTVTGATQITATTPAGSAGAVNVTVTNSSGQSTTLASAFTYLSGPTLSGLSPASGPTTGGTAVTLTGTGFASGASVTFGSAAATSVTVTSATQITANAPASSAGAVNVSVTNSRGQSTTLASAFTYVAPPTLTSLSPARGPTTGGTAVTLTGTGFLSGASVSFGSTASGAVTVQSSTQITAIAPAASAAGAVNVTVTNSNGQSASLANAFTFVLAPSLSAISPTSGATAGGTAVTLTGSGFASGATVTFGSAAASSVAVVSSTQMTAVTPAASAGTVNVTVTNSSGYSAGLASAFTYQSASDSSNSSTLCTPTLVLPVGNPSVPYYATLACSGGTPPYTWNILSGTLPSGLTFNPSTGLISGTPTQAATVSLTAQVTDSTTPTALTEQVAVTLDIATLAATAPQLPQTFINATVPNTSGYVTRTVCASGCNYASVQAALNDVHNQGGDSNGEIIELAPGATFTENDTLPAYTMAAGKWVIITTNTAAANLPAAGVRITPSYSSVLANIVTNNSAAVVQTANNANYYWFMGVGLGVAAGVSTNYGVFVVGDGDTSTATLPSNIVLDRCLIWGNGTGNVSRGVAANGASLAVINSYIYNIAAVGSDSQAIAAWNSPGPIKIANNFLEGSTENVMFGGADPSIPNLVNSDIEIRRNHFFKPLTWDPGDASYAGTEWQVKDLFELKNAQRVLMEGNLMENNWAQAQDGHAVLFTPRNQEGNCSWCTVSNITFRYNIVQHSGAGFNISGADSASPCGDGSGPSLPATYILISNVLVRDINNGSEYMNGTGDLIQMLNGTDSCTSSPPANISVNHLTGFQNGKTGNFGDNYSNDPMPDVSIQNSIFPEGTYGWMGTNEGEGNGTFGAYFSSLVFTANVQEGGSSSSYSDYPGNYFPSSWSSVAFTDATDCMGGTYSLMACTLQSSSPYHAAGTDEADLGANIGAIYAATWGVQ